MEKYLHPDVVARDNLHYNWSKSLSYNKIWNFTVSEREGGKSTSAWFLLWKAFNYQGCPSIVFRRRIVDISTVYIDDVENLLNKFLAKKIKLIYKKGDIKQGVVDVRLGEQGTNYSWQQAESLPIFFRVIALSNPMSRIKSLMLPHLKYFFIDEFIVNLRMNEKYLDGEFFLIKEIYTTFNREADKPIRILAAGNPYSVYCPLLNGLGVDSSKLKPGAFIVGPNYTVNCFVNPPELKEMILKKNPMYEFDDAYMRYAFNGEAVNDANIKLQKTEPKGFKLKFVIKIGQDLLSVHRRGPNSRITEKWWVCRHKAEWAQHIAKNRKIHVFNFGDMTDGCEIPDIDIRREYFNLNESLRKNEVCYNSIDAKYMMEDIYDFTH